MAKARILLMPTLTEIEWKIAPQLSEWAEVASFDAPGVGDEPGDPTSAYAIVERGLIELDRRGWERCVVAGDEIGAVHAVRLAAARPSAVRGLALGHAALSLSRTGSRPVVNAEVAEALVHMGKVDYRSFVRALAQATQEAYDDDLADRYMARVNQPTAGAYMDELLAPDPVELEAELRSLEVPLLLVEHRGCVLWTRQGFEDIVAAFPEARTASLTLKPSTNPEFAELLRDFCTTLPD